MTNLNSLNIDFAEYFAKQGYDIYDVNSDFYNDVCSPAYYEDNDITLNDRNTEICPNNISINKNNCTYKSVNLENKTFLYECDFTEYYNSENLTNENDNSNEQENKFFNYFLDLINYKIIICIDIIKYFKNYKNNIGVIFCTIISFTSVLFIVIFFSYGIKKIKLNIYKEIQINNKLRKKIIQKEKENKKKVNKKENKNKNKNENIYEI